MTIPSTDLAAVDPETPTIEPDIALPGRRRFRFVANLKAAIGLEILGFFVLLAVIGPWIDGTLLRRQSSCRTVASL